MDDQLDPLQKVELALLRAEYQKRFQVMTAFVKEKVGEGVEYRNDVVRVVVSETGVYYELNDLPEDFSGAVSDRFTHSFVAPEAGVALLGRAIELTRQATTANTRHLSIFALYTRRGIIDRKNCYMYEFRADDEHPDRPAVSAGAFRPGVMPLFFKVKLHAEGAQEAIGLASGVLFCMANAGDRNLLIRIPYDGDQVVNLADLPASNTIN